MSEALNVGADASRSQMSKAYSDLDLSSPFARRFGFSSQKASEVHALLFRTAAMDRDTGACIVWKEVADVGTA